MKTPALLTAGILIAASIPLRAAEGPPAPTPPGAPGARPAGIYSRPVPIGPKDSSEIARPLSGKVMLVANAPREVQPASAEFFLNDRPLGKVTDRPFVLEFDTKSVADGDYTVRASAADASGTEIWSATAKVRIRNSGPAEAGTEPTPIAGEPLNNHGTGNHTDRRREINPPESAVDGSNGTRTQRETDDPGTPVSPSGTRNTEKQALEPDKAYTSAKYGFSIRHPGSWVVRDRSDSKPRERGGFWIVIGEDPVERSPMVVNIHRRKLDSGSNAETFARYNRYVESWDRKVLNGNTAFVTSSGTPQSRDVVHRTILISRGYAWMFNLTDRTGGPASESAALFSRMLDTFRVTDK